MKKVLWPDNRYFISLNLMLVVLVFNSIMIYLQIKFASNASPVMLSFLLNLFIFTVFIAFFFTQRIVINENNVIGPSAYGKRRNRTTIPKNDAEAFYEKRSFGRGYLVIRHKTSSRQIFVPFLYFSKETIKKIMDIFPNQSSNPERLKRSDLEQ